MAVQVDGQYTGYAVSEGGKALAYEEVVVCGVEGNRPLKYDIGLAS